MIGNTKNPIKVFGAIINLIKDWLVKAKPISFYFTAKENSRKRLYDRFAKLIINNTEYKFDKGLEADVKELLDADDEIALKDKIYAFTRSTK